MSTTIDSSGSRAVPGAVDGTPPGDASAPDRPALREAGAPQLGVTAVGAVATLALGWLILHRSGEVPAVLFAIGVGPRLRALPQPVRLHLGLAPAGRRTPGQGAARPHADDRGRGDPVRTDPRRRGRLAGRSHVRLAGADRLRRRRRLVPVRARHADRRRLRLGHPVRRRERTDRDRDHAARLHRGLGHRGAALPLVDRRPAQPRPGLAGRPAPGLPRRLADHDGDHRRGRRRSPTSWAVGAGSRRSTALRSPGGWPAPSAAPGRCGSGPCCWPVSTP